MNRLLFALFSGLALTTASAQPLSNMVFSVGTSAQDSSHQAWSYVVVGSPQNQLLTGKRFAVYGKTVGTFTARGFIFRQTNSVAVSNLLNQSVSLGENLSALGSSLTTLFPKITGSDLSHQVLSAAQSFPNDPTLLILSRLHPGLGLCLGQSFSEKISALTVYEIREVDPNSGAALNVVGRVTIDPANPVVLPAPGFPFQVISNAPSDDLRIRLRWGSPDALRRLSLLQFGYDVWRIPQALAEAANYNVTPPTLSDLLSNPSFTKVNTLPIIATTDYAPLAGVGGPDDASDRSTYFFSDRNGRSLGNAHFPAGQVPIGYSTPGFSDGDAFYYFITARDILGRDGLPSPGGLATACRKMPPGAPTKLSVLNTTQAGQQRLLVRWQQDTNASDNTTEYWVYRWSNPALALTNDPIGQANLLGVVPQNNGTNFGVYVDSSPMAPGPSNYWYTVRAATQNACGETLLSPNSVPASGVLRDRSAPNATTGQLVSSCGSAVALFQNFDFVTDPNATDTNNWNYRVTVTRRDSGVAWARITAGNTNEFNTQTFGPLYFPPDGNTLTINFSQPVTSYGGEFDVSCIAGTYYGEVSVAAVSQSTNTPGAGQVEEANFGVGELLLTALSSSDPYLQAANGGIGACYPPTNPTRDITGTLHMKFPNANGAPVLIQYSTNGGAAWVDLGVTKPDTNGAYSIFLCPCVISALPALQGCAVNLPDEGDCDQHIARAGDSGAVAPIQVLFPIQPRTHEYRVYRSVDGADPTMIAQSAALFDPSNPNNQTSITDDAMPPGAARLCYFVQLLDENGNGSPLSLIGCKDSLPAKPPRPTLSQPRAIGDTTHPQVALNWFCPTNGVYRFDVRLHQDPAAASQAVLGQFLSLDLLALPSPNPNFRFLGLKPDRALTSLFDDWRVTPPIGPSFGPGPQFTLVADVTPNVTYHICLVADGPVAGKNNQIISGDPSSEWTFVWKPPPTNVTVPWPARPLPPVTQFDDAAAVPYLPFPRVAAMLMTYYDSKTQKSLLDAQYPVGIRIGQVSTFYNSYNAGSTNFAGYQAFSDAPADPNANVFKRLSLSSDLAGQPLLPIVIYRQQVTNANFLRVSGNLTQVTPLVEKIPWTVTYLNASPIVNVPDLLIALGQETWADEEDHFLYLRDQQPVIFGAKYQYYAVRLDAQREISEVIDAGSVEIPLTR
jgi:hypothetical protein